MRILVSDVNQVHADACKNRILAECPTAIVITRLESLSASVTWAIANGYNIISRSTTGLSDSRNESEGDTGWIGGTATIGAFSNAFSSAFDSIGRTHRVGIVHALGSNSHILDTNPSQLDIISSVSGGDGAGNCVASYGPGLEFFCNEEAKQSYSTARIAGMIGQLITDHPTWTFQDARMALRQTASFYATAWIQDGGYGYVDKAAANTVTDLAMFSPTRKEKTNFKNRISFIWASGKQTDFHNTVIAFFETEPTRTTEPTSSQIVYAGTLEEAICRSNFNGTYWFVHYSRNSELTYSLIESFDKEQITLAFLIEMLWQDMIHKIIEFTAQKKTFNTVLLMWGIDPPNNQAVFKIYRALNDADEYELLTEGFPTSFLDIDDLIKVNPNIKYKITSGDASMEAIIDAEGDPLLYEVAGANLFNLKEGKAGTRSFAFCKSDNATRCPECWSVEAQKVFKTDCGTCDGTGIIKGYKGPIELYISYGQENKIISYLNGLERSKTVTLAWTANIPILRVGDIIVSSSTKRYIVDRPPGYKKMVNVKNSSEFIVKQDMVLELLHDDHMAYAMELPEQ